MIGRILVAWVVLCGAFLLGWWAAIRLHLPACAEEKAELARALFERDMKIAALEQEREDS